MTILLRKPGPPQLVEDVPPPTFYDQRFAECVAKGGRLLSLYDQAVFSEGPVWWPARTILVWSDIEGRRVLGWHSNGQVEVIADATPFINGHTVDTEGNLIHCEHGGRGLSCTTPAGQTTALLKDYKGRRFNSPNDVTCAPDGTLWFTDPAFGLHSPRQGALDEPELDHRSVFRFDTRTGQIRGCYEPLANPCCHFRRGSHRDTSARLFKHEDLPGESFGGGSICRAAKTGLHLGLTKTMT